MDPLSILIHTAQLDQMQDTTEVFKAFGQWGILGTVTFLLGKRFLATSDEDRRWIRDAGERNMLVIAEVQSTNRLLVDTCRGLLEANKLLVETNKSLATEVALGKKDGR